MITPNGINFFKKSTFIQPKSIWKENSKYRKTFRHWILWFFCRSRYNNRRKLKLLEEEEIDLFLSSEDKNINCIECDKLPEDIRIKIDAKRANGVLFKIDY